MVLLQSLKHQKGAESKVQYAEFIEI